MIRVVYALGYLWSILTVLLGLIFLGLAKLFNQITKCEWRGPALLVHMEGFWADWMQEKNASGYVYYGHTVGFCVFLYEEVDPKLILHEQRHVYQQMVLGTFDVLYQLFAMIYGRFKYGSFFQAYRNLWTEKDARRVSGEDPDPNTVGAIPQETKSVEDMKTLSGEK